MEIIHQLLPNDILQALGWTVLHSLWQAFAVALLLAAYLLAWQKSDARKRYLAGNAALGLILLSAMVTFAYYLDRSQTELGTPSDIWSGDDVYSDTYFLESGSSWYSQYFAEHMPVIVTVWGIGLVFFLLKLMGGLLYVQRLKTRMNAPLPNEWQEYVEQLCLEMHISRPVRLLESALAQTPMVLGWLKPVILFPIGAVNHLTPTQVEAILAHEMAHVLRQDYLLNLLQSLVETIFYFNPAVWWVSAHVRTERENCCDDIAVKYCGNSLAYAKALVGLQELQMAAPALAMPFSKNKNQLLLRIQRILQPSQNKSNVMEKLSATLLLTVAVVLLSVQANTPFGNFLSNVIAKGIPVPDDDSTPTIDYDYDEIAYAPTDTIPSGNQDTHVHYTTDDESIEFKLEEDEIMFLKIDGEVIPPSRYNEYEDQIHEIMAEIAVPEAPEPTEFAEFPDFPAVPEPPSFEHFPGVVVPPVPPIPPVSTIPGTRKITTQKNRNSTTFIIETEDGSEPVEITVKDGKNGVVIINGQEITGLKKGDKTIIMQDLPQPNFQFDFSEFTPENFHFEFPEPAEFSGFDEKALAELEALRSFEISPEAAREWELKAKEWAKSEEARALMQDRQAELKAQLENLREQQSQLSEEQRAEIEKAIEQSRKAHKDAMRQLEKELKAAKRRSGSM